MRLAVGAQRHILDLDSKCRRLGARNPRKGMMLNAQGGGANPSHLNAWTATSTGRGGIVVCVGNEEIATFFRQ